MNPGILAAAPIVVPAVVVILTTLTRKQPGLQRFFSYLGAILLFISAVALLALAAADTPAKAFFGDWGEPFAIAFQIDRVSALMLLMTAVMAIISLIFLDSDADTTSEGRHPLLLPLIHGLLFGVSGAFSTADLFNLYVWLEVILISAAGLLAIGGRLDQLDATYKYFVINMLGTLVLLMAVAMVYSTTGHLNYGAIAQAAPLLTPTITTLVLTILSLAFLIKAGAFPFFAWLPASYHSLPAPVLALFAGLLAKVGVYAVLRMVGDVFAPASFEVYEVLGWIALCTMLLGVIGAAYHWDIRRILAFHSISQIGYILLAIALFSQAGNAAALFYIIHHAIVKGNLFLIGAIIWRLSGSYDLRQIGGLYALRPGLAILFAIFAASLVGIPPFTGFWSKVLVVQETIAQGRVIWTIVALLVGALTLYSMAKIWMEAFWKPHPDAAWNLPQTPRLGSAWVATLGLAVVMLAISLHPQPLLDYVNAAAKALGGP